MPVYLHYLDRELGASVNFKLSTDQLFQFTNFLLKFAYEELYCGLSLLWEQPAGREMRWYIQRLLENGQLQAITAYASAPDFLSAKRSEYAHQVRRYPAYFDPLTESEILQFKRFSTVRSKTTEDLVQHLTRWSCGEAIPRWSNADDGERMIAAISATLEQRKNRAITIALFRPHLRRRKASDIAEREVARSISLGYTTHYLEILKGACPTGLPGLTYYDDFCRSFPYLDWPILTRLGEILRCNRPIEEDMLSFLSARGSPAHIFFVTAVRQAIALACPASGEIVHRRVATVERLLHGVSLIREPNTPLPKSWEEHFLAVGERANLLAAQDPVRNHRDSLFAVESAYSNSGSPRSADLLIVTATKVELEEVLRRLQSPVSPAPPEFYGANTYFRGRCGSYETVVVRCEPGAVGRDAAILVIEEAVRAVRPRAVVMAGIAFGADANRQRLTDVLVSKMVAVYEPQRVGTGKDAERMVFVRGPRVPSSQVLYNRFRDCSLGWAEDGAEVHFGTILSGEKLVDNPALKIELLALEPEALGGEMEGAGLYAAADRRRVEWILVKAICDWGDGVKNDDSQRAAAKHAASLVWYVLQRPHVLEGCKPFEMS